MVKNRDIFLEDPTTYTIPNNGVAQVINPSTSEEWAVLRYELEHFVCEGEYKSGLQRILTAYLANINGTQQPAIWVSGFYGSGKSHFVRVLEYLWRDTVFPDRARARGLAMLPNEIAELLMELTTAGRREGGLWSAAGTLGAGSGTSVRLALLGILFRSAGLPEQYAPARFVIWLMQNGHYKDVRTEVERKGSHFATQLNNMYVSSVLAQALLDSIPGFASTTVEARNFLRMQFPIKDDISDDELLTTMHDVLALQSTTTGKLPCTLLIFDELQQFIGDDSDRTLHVQNVVQACSAHFGNRLLFVATGQSAIQATLQLQKLQGRFTVRVPLTDTDVERVVREVVLRKQPAQTPALKTVLDAASGEINRHLAGTNIGPRPADAERLIPDYPLLPARSRFWENVLRAVDSMGQAGQLRTQLRIVHDAVREIADAPLGTVVAGDVIYNQLKTDMLQSGVLLRDVATSIEQLNNGTDDGKLRSRLCATIFLLNRIQTGGAEPTGLQANVATLADLLVGDVTDVNANTKLRQCIPPLLDSLVRAGRL
ncbi:MAG: BREX system P-loop protein BrxC, partial [Ktedonobacteraceae bacterium]